LLVGALDMILNKAQEVAVLAVCVLQQGSL
jgi:hypothetical protein